MSVAQEDRVLRMTMVVAPLQARPLEVVARRVLRGASECRACGAPFYPEILRDAAAAEHDCGAARREVCAACHRVQEARRELAAVTRTRSARGLGSDGLPEDVRREMHQ